MSRTYSYRTTLGWVTVICGLLIIFCYGYAGLGGWLRAASGERQLADAIAFTLAGLFITWIVARHARQFIFDRVILENQTLVVQSGRATKHMNLNEIIEVEEGTSFVLQGTIYTVKTEEHQITFTRMISKWRELLQVVRTGSVPVS